MKLSELFDCKNPIPFLEWFNYCDSQLTLPNSKKEWNEKSAWQCAQIVNGFLSQSFTKYMVIRPEAVNGYAKGFYSCKCGRCKKIFMGDKRAVTCEDCSGIRNWQPVFLGEWTTSKEDPNVPMAINLPEWNGGCEIYEDMTIYEVIKYSNDEELPLQLNPNYEI